MIRASSALLCALALSSIGCKNSGASPEVPTWLNRPSWALGVVSRRVLTAENSVIGEDYERGRPALDPRHNRVFVGTADRALYALRAEDLSTIWRFETLSYVQCEPLYDPGENTLYFGSNDGALYKLGADHGDLVWRFSTNAEISRAPLLSGGTLFVTNSNDTIVALDPASGELRWTQHRTPAYGMEIAGYAGVSAHGGRVYTSFSDGRVFAFDAADGHERWSADLAAEAESQGPDTPRYLDADATPVVVDTSQGTLVVAASYAGGVYALDAATGARVWASEKAKGVVELALWDEPAHPSLDGGPPQPRRRMLLAASGTTGLWSLDVDDGHVLWRRSLPEGGVSAPVPAAGAVLLSTTRYGLFLISPIDGKVIDGIDTGTGFSQSPAAHGRRAFVMSNAGALLGLHLDAPRPR